MVNFVQDPQPVTPPVSVDDSRLTRGNRSFETLFEGLGNAAVGAVKAKEAIIESDINKQIAEAVDSAASPSAGIFDESLEGGTGTPRSVLPQDIQRAEKEFARIQRAKSQGAISDSMFIQNVNPLLKRLKTQYPGFSRDIDLAYSRATGSSTANQIRKARLAEEKEAFRRQTQMQTRRDKILAQSRQFGIVNPMGKSNEFLQEEMAAKSVSIAETNRRISELTLKEKENRLQSKDVVAFATTELDKAWRDNYLQLTEEGKVNPESPMGILQGKLANLTESAKDGLSPEEITDFIAAATQLKLTAEQQVDAFFSQQINGKSLGALIGDSSEVENIKKNYVKRITDIEDAVKKGDFALLKANDILVNAGTNAGVLRLRKAEPGIVMIESLRKALGPEVFNTMLLNSQKIKGVQNLNDRFANIAMASMLNVQGNIAGGKKDALASGINTMGEAGAPSMAHIATIESVAENLANPNMPPAEVANQVKTQFTDNLLASLNVYKDSNRKPVFLRLTNPRITENLKRANDPEALNQYNDFMEQGFKLLYEADVRVLVEAIEEAPALDVTWNPKTMQIDTGVNSSFTTGEGSGLIQSAFDIIKNFRGRNRIASINSFLARWGSAQQALGRDSGDASKAVFNLMQETVPELNFGAAKREGPITTFIESFSKSFEDATGISSEVLKFNPLTAPITLPETLGLAGGQGTDTLEGDSGGASIQALGLNVSAIPQGREPIADLIVGKFAEAGLSKIHQVAALANAIRESNLNPAASNQSGEDSVGLFQLNARGGLGSGMSFAERSDPAINTDTILRAAMADKEFREATTIEEAVRAFVHNVERPRDKVGETRRRTLVARKLLQQ